MALVAQAIKIAIRLAVFLLIFTLIVSIIPNLVFNLPSISWLTTPIKKILNIALYYLPDLTIVLPLVLVKITIASAHRGNRLLLALYNWLLGITE